MSIRDQIHKAKIIRKQNCNKEELDTLELYIEIAEEILEHSKRSAKVEKNLTFGYEIEYGLAKKNFKQNYVKEQERESLITDLQNKLNLDVELGSSQLEFASKIFDIPFRANSLISSFESVETAILDHLSSDTLLVSSGINPFLKSSQIQTTDKLKYKKVPSFHNKILKDKNVKTHGAEVLSVCQAVQWSIGVNSYEDLIEITNRLYLIGYIILALAGNARFVSQQDTCWNDIRAHLWETTHDIRSPVENILKLSSRIGLPDNYFSSIEDILLFMSKFPFILHSDSKESVLKVATGMNWLFAKPKFYPAVKDSLKKGQVGLVEFRPIATQPDSRENAAICVLALGRVLYSLYTMEEYIDFRRLKENYLTAMKLGTVGKYWVRKSNDKYILVNFSDLYRDEVRKAIQGLNYYGFENEWQNIIEESYLNSSTIFSPSEKLACELYKKGDFEIDRLFEIMIKQKHLKE
jgi:gamma-glutamyl:cysteine ligase YbdK (ATP-grasp superfamily)